MARGGIGIPIALARQNKMCRYKSLIFFNTDMKHVKQKTALGVCTLLAAALTACGGGGDSGTSASSSTSGTDISTLATATYNYTTFGADATAYPLTSTGTTSVLTTGTGAKLNLDSVDYPYVSSSKSFTGITASVSSTIRSTANSSLPAAVVLCKTASSTITHAAVAATGVTALTDFTNFANLTLNNINSCNTDSSGNSVTDGTWTFNSTGTSVDNTYSTGGGGSQTDTISGANLTAALSSSGFEFTNDTNGTKTVRVYPMSYTNGGTTKYFFVAHVIKTGSYAPSALFVAVPSNF